MKLYLIFKTDKIKRLLDFVKIKNIIVYVKTKHFQLYLRVLLSYKSQTVLSNVKIRT